MFRDVTHLKSDLIAYFVKNDLSQNLIYFSTFLHTRWKNLFCAEFVIKNYAVFTQESDMSFLITRTNCKNAVFVGRALIQHGPFQHTCDHTMGVLEIEIYMYFLWDWIPQQCPAGNPHSQTHQRMAVLV